VSMHVGAGLCIVIVAVCTGIPADQGGVGGVLLSAEDSPPITALLSEDEGLMAASTAMDDAAEDERASQQAPKKTPPKKVPQKKAPKKPPSPPEVVQPRVSQEDVRAFRINGNMFVKHSLYVRNQLKMRNKGFGTVLNGNNGLLVYARHDDQDYGAIFKTFRNNGDIRFAHSSGMMLDSHTNAKLGYNARFRNQGASEVLLAHHGGAALVAKTLKGVGWAGQFESDRKATVKIGGPDGVGLHSVCKGGPYSARFESSKDGITPKVTLASADGSGVVVDTFSAQGHKAWSGSFTANRAIKIRLAHTSGQALRSFTRKKKVWNAEFIHDTVNVKVGNYDGQALKSHTSSSKNPVWNAYFGNQEMTAVRLAHSDGTAIAAWSFQGKSWNAIFGNGKPAASMVKIGHGNGMALESITNKGITYNSLFSNQGTNIVKLAGPHGTGLYSETKKGKTFNTIITNKATASVTVKLGGPRGEGIVASVVRGTAPAGRFQTSKSSYVELSGRGGSGIRSVTGNGQSAKWNAYIQNGVGKKRSTTLRFGGKRGFALYSKTECSNFITWNSVFKNEGVGKPTVKLAHTSGQGIYSHTTSEQNDAYNAFFGNVKISSVSLAHSNGRALHSHSESQKAYNARFGNGKHSRVYLAHGEGLSLLSTSSGNAWNAKFTSKNSAEVSLAHWDGKALYAKNDATSNSYAVHFESKTKNGKPAASVHLAHPRGHGLSARTFSKKSYAGQFSAQGVHMRLATGTGRAIDVTSETDLFSGRFRAGKVKKQKGKYRVSVELGKASGEAIRAVTEGSEAWNTYIAAGKRVQLRLAHNSGQAINSETSSGDVPNAQFSRRGQTNVQLGGVQGLAIRSSSTSGDKHNAIFSHGQASLVKLAAPSGAALQSTTLKGNTWNAIFEEKTDTGGKSKVQLVHTDGTAIRSSTAGGTKFNAEFAHKGQSVVRLSHGSGLAIDSVTRGNSAIKVPATGWQPPAQPGVKPAPTGPKQDGGELDETAFIQTTAGEGAGASAAVQTFNARFQHEGRASLHIAHQSGTVLHAKSLAGHGSVGIFEKGNGDQLQRVILGHGNGTPLIASTQSTQSWAAKISGAQSTVYLAGPRSLLYADTKQGVAPENAKRSVVTVRNNDMNLFRVRNDGRVVIGENRKGFLHVSGNAHIEGSLRTIHKGKSVDVSKMLHDMDTRNEELHRMVQEMSKQNELLMSRVSSLEAMAESQK